MTVRASWNGTVVAESDDTVIVEGNHYFPLKAVNTDLLSPSDTHTHCHWKGEASYYDLNVAGERNKDAVWYYAEPFAAAEEIRGHVAFWHGVQVEAEEGDGRPGPTPPPR
jgi:uncharacterized protein (DUF427 family)